MPFAGLAESLHSEFKLYGIDVHIAFPGTIYSKGYEEENACKPKVTLTIEATDGGSTPEFVASVILGGTYALFFLSLLPRSPARHITLPMLLGSFGSELTADGC